MKRIIHFAHANGFPAKTYSKLFSALRPDFIVNFLEKHAHNPKYPVKVGWNELRDELGTEIQNRYHQPIIGIGHSLGGILHFLLAVEKPQLYSHIILLDAPLVSPVSGLAWRAFKIFRGVENFPIVRTTVLRRNKWASRKEAFEHFYKKPAFRKFDKDVLNDYIQYGVVEHEGKFQLYFDPEIEAEIYRTLPIKFKKFINQLKTPSYYIGGTESNEARLARISFMQRNFPFNFQFLAGSHLFPLESPIETAKTIKKILL